MTRALSRSAAHAQSNRLRSPAGETLFATVAFDDPLSTWKPGRQRPGSGRARVTSQAPGRAVVVALTTMRGTLRVTPNCVFEVQWTTPSIPVHAVCLLEEPRFRYRLARCELAGQPEGIDPAAQLQARFGSYVQVWLLSGYTSAIQAEVAERRVRRMFRLPANDLSDPVEAKNGDSCRTNAVISETFTGARDCLYAHSLFLDTPFYQPGDGTGTSQFFPVHAINVLAGFMSVPIQPTVETGKTVTPVESVHLLTSNDPMIRVEADDGGIYVSGVKIPPAGNWATPKRRVPDHGATRPREPGSDDDLQRYVPPPRRNSGVQLSAVQVANDDAKKSSSC